MHTMKPALCVLSDVSTQFNIIGVTVQSVEELNTKLIAEMKAKAVRHPVIVFKRNKSAARLKPCKRSAKLMGSTFSM